MKILFHLLSILLFVFVACNDTKKVDEQSSTEKNSSSVPKTYAEISIKEGGVWKDRKYEGGTFKNVQSLKVPAQHTEHSTYIRYEGPGWESSKIAYRLYLDWRNAIDIYGKVKDTLALSKIGLDSTDSYHNMADWGMDILKVDKGLGIGAIGRYVKNEVLHFNAVDSTLATVENTNENSIVNINYYGWKTAGEKIDLNSHLSISPEQRYTKHTFQVSKKIKGICTGIVNHGLKPLKKESENKKWAYIATYGKQTLVPDNLGMAILYKVEDIETVIDWKYDHLLIFKPTTQKVIFYFLGAWEQEKGGIKTEEGFVEYLNKLLAQLNSNDKL